MFKQNALWWAAGLFVSGLLLLIWNFEVLAPYEPWTQILLALLLFVVSVGFFTGYFGVRNVWRFIPGWIMGSLVLMVLLSLFPNSPNELIAALLFLGVAVAFIHIYLTDRIEQWWALLPAGFMLVIFLLIAATSLTTNIVLLGVLLFGGMGVVFFAVYLLSPGAQQWWALIAGGVLVFSGLFLLTAQQERPSGLFRWWPILLILIGLVIAWHSDSSNESSAARPWFSLRRSPAVSPNPSTTETVAPVQEITAPLPRGQLGEYHQPAPGASVELLSEGDEDRSRD